MYNVFNGALFRQYAVVFAINLNCLSFGLALTWPSPVLVKLANASETVLSRPLEQEEASWIASITFLSAAASFLTASVLIDRIGRKYCVILSSAIRMITALLFLFATEVWMLMLGRAIDGLSQGLIVGVVPVYASEIACKEVRGALGVMLQIFSSIGTVIMLSVGPFVSYFNLNLIFTLSVLLTTIPTVFLPDSPNFLYSKGKHEESKKVLVFLRCSEVQANEELKEYATNKNDEKLSFLSIFCKRTFQKSFRTSGFMCVMTYLIGYNCVITYLQTILNDTHTNVSSEVASGIIGAIQLVASFATMLFTDKFGRKPILVSTLIGTAIGMIGLGIFFKLSRSGIEVSGFLNFLPLISLLIVVFCYSSGLGSLFWVVIAEVFDDRSRGVGTTLTLLIGVIPSFLTVRYFSALVDIVGPSPTFWASAVLCVILAGYIAFRLPETKGKSFTEIQDAFGAVLPQLAWQQEFIKMGDTETKKDNDRSLVKATAKTVKYAYNALAGFVANMCLCTCLPGLKCLFRFEVKGNSHDHHPA